MILARIVNYTMLQRFVVQMERSIRGRAKSVPITVVYATVIPLYILSAERCLFRGQTFQ